MICSPPVDCQYIRIYMYYFSILLAISSLKCCVCILLTKGHLVVAPLFALLNRHLLRYGDDADNTIENSSIFSLIQMW